MKHLVDVDDELLHTAMQMLGTQTIKATVEEALKRTVNDRRERQRRALEGIATLLAEHPGFDRSEAW